MKTITELIEVLAQGLRPVVIFQPGIVDKEAYAESNMRARLIGQSCTADADGVHVLTFDFTEFDEFNKAFESSNYYDKAGNALLNARQAGFYKLVDTVYVDSSEPLDALFQLEAAPSTRLFAKFKNESPGGSYVAWLETELENAYKALGR